MLVDRIVAAAWKQRRLNRVLKAHTAELAHQAQQRIELEAKSIALHEKCVQPLFENDLAELRRLNAVSIDTRAFSDENAPMLDRLLRHEHRLEMTIHRSMRELQNLQKRSQNISDDSAIEADAGPRVAA